MFAKTLNPTRVSRSVAARAGKTGKGSAASAPSASLFDVRDPEVVYEYVRNMPGVSDPFPNVFDPAGFLKSKSTTIRDVRRWRESEVTHGRVAMLAALGFIIGEQLEDFPLFFNADGHITGPAIYQFQQVEARGTIFWIPLVIAIGLCESYRVALGWATPTGQGFNSLKDEYLPGDLGFDPLGLKPTDPEELKVLQTKEINNGRLAMIAIAAFVAQELVVKAEIFEHLFTYLEREIVDEVVDVEREFIGAEKAVEAAGKIIASDLVAVETTVARDVKELL